MHQLGTPMLATITMYKVVRLNFFALRLIQTSHCEFTVDCSVVGDRKIPISLQKCNCLLQVAADLQCSVNYPSLQKCNCPLQVAADLQCSVN